MFSSAIINFGLAKFFDKPIYRTEKLKSVVDIFNACTIFSSTMYYVFSRLDQFLLRKTINLIYWPYYIQERHLLEIEISLHILIKVYNQ